MNNINKGGREGEGENEQKVGIDRVRERRGGIEKG